MKADIPPVTNSKNDSDRLIIEKNECTSTNGPNTSLVKESGDSPATKLDANDSVASTKKTNGIAV